MKKYVLLMALSCCALLGWSQTMSDTQVLQYVQREMKAGTSQAQIATSLLQRGATMQQLQRIRSQYEQTGETKTVGSGTKTGDIKGDECNKTAYANYSPGLGNGGSVAIVTEDEGGLIRANFFIHTITVTYTIEGVGSEVRFNANSTTPSFATNANPYYLTQDSVRFKLDIPNYDNDHFYVHNSNDNAFIKWEPNSGFSIAVTGVTFNGCNATYKAGLSTRTGSSWIKTYSAASRGYSSNAKIGQNTSTYTTTFTTSSNTTVFPSGNALGNNDYFNVFSRKKDSQTDKADGSGRMCGT